MANKSRVINSCDLGFDCIEQFDFLVSIFFIEPQARKFESDFKKLCCNRKP